MAITFKSKDAAAKTLVIGGTAIMGTTSDDLGVVGPFPRYSIAREDLTLADGTYLNSKFNITVTGTATLKSGDSQDMLKKGERQSRVQGEAIILAQLNRNNEWPMQGNGVLEISPYGGINTNIIKYLDARITSLELPEQNETAGVQNQEYTIQFEAYQDASKGGNANDPNGTEQPTYNLSSVEESWELTPAEDRYVYKDNKLAGDAVVADGDADPPIEAEDAADTPYKTFTLTHNLSATGLKKLHPTLSGLADDGESWRQAAEYIGARLAKTGDPLSAIAFNTLNQTEDADSNKFNPGKMDSDDTNLGYNLSDATKTNPDFNPGAEVSEANPTTLPNAQYKAYDHVRTVNSNVSAGSYSVTDTWVIAYGNTAGQSAIIDTEISVDNSNMESANTVTVSGTVTGLDTTAATAQQHNKYTNALAAYTKLAKSFFDAAEAAHTEYLNRDPDTAGTVTDEQPLKNTEYSKNVGENKAIGTITFSVSFNDKITKNENVIEDTLQVDDSGGTDVVAIIGVLLKASGPVIQDMGTVTEKRKSVSYTAKLKTDQRESKPTFGKGIVDGYQPGGSSTSYLAGNSESWNETTGDYSVTREWVYASSGDGFQAADAPTPTPTSD